MSKLIVWNIMSLDGYFEGREPWDLATHELVSGQELEQFSKDQLLAQSRHAQCADECPLCPQKRNSSARVARPLCANNIHAPCRIKLSA